MHPDTPIYDERRRRDRSWEPVPLHLPLYDPRRHPRNEDEPEDDEETSTDRGVTIIDMTDYTEIDL